MADLRPFAALRPRPDLAARLCELPYDVLSTAEARGLAADNRFSFFHVSKPEIDLPAGTEPEAPGVYVQGRRNLLRLIADGALVRDARPGYYLYRQVMGAHAQTGLVAVASCDEYRQGIIRKHELTRPDKEDDRLRHMEALNAQTGPAFLIYRSVPELDGFVRQRSGAPPAIDFTAVDGVRHSAWVIDDEAGIAFVQSATSRVPRLYIADGHHRTAAAARVCRSRQGIGGSSHFLAVAFPHDQLQVLPYHRVLKDLNDHTPGALLDRLNTGFETVEAETPPLPRPHEVGLYLDHRWHCLRFRAALVQSADAIEALDVSLLQRHALAPVFGIENPRTSRRLGFVGGIRGVGELERLVDDGEFACAFALCPTRVEDLMAIADAGGLMPPKSTWFEPKLRDGMFCHALAEPAEG